MKKRSIKFPRPLPIEKALQVYYAAKRKPTVCTASIVWRDPYFVHTVPLATGGECITITGAQWDIYGTCWHIIDF